jgi:hypothetical protein
LENSNLLLIERPSTLVSIASGRYLKHDKNGKAILICNMLPGLKMSYDIVTFAFRSVPESTVSTLSERKSMVMALFLTSRSLSDRGMIPEKMFLSTKAIGIGSNARILPIEVKMTKINDKSNAILIFLLTLIDYRLPFYGNYIIP